MKSKLITHNTLLFENVRLLIQQAQQHVVRNINTTMLITYFQIGKMIVEDEQRGKQRAAYATETLKKLSTALHKEFGKGYSVDNLQFMRKFYLVYSKYEPGAHISSINPNKPIYEPVARKSSKKGVHQYQFHLSWSHYVQLLKIQDEDERRFYEIEAVQSNWSKRELIRQFNSGLYERVALSRDKKGVKELAKKGQIIENPTDALKSHYVLEFLGLEEDNRYSESHLETAIINKLEHFMLELGKGFCFVGRQKRFTFEGDSFYVDLVFYNRLLKCFVLFDLKIGKLTHQDIGQMQMYVNYYDRVMKEKSENKTIGIILCREENKAVVEFTLPEDKKQIFTKEYKLYLPSKEELKKQLK